MGRLGKIAFHRPVTHPKRRAKASPARPRAENSAPTQRHKTYPKSNADARPPQRVGRRTIVVALLARRCPARLCQLGDSREDPARNRASGDRAADRRARGTPDRG